MLTSLKNPLVKEIRKLQKRSERHQQNLCLLEGTNLLEVASEINYSLSTLLTTSAWQNKNYQLWQRLQAQAQRWETVSEEVIKSLATTINPDGVLATAKRIYREDLPPEKIKLGLVLEKIQDPGNLGTIIRTGVAMDVDMLWLSEDSVDLDNPKVLRSSVGEWFRIQAKAEKDILSLVKNYRDRGYQVIATCLDGDETHWQINFSLPTLILLGNESQGLSSDLTDLATNKVKIPLANGVESLNVAIATALILGECQRQNSK